MSRLGVLTEALRVGVVTEPYPFEPLAVPEGFRGKPVIDPEKCLGCGACANVCPPNALSIEDDVEEGVRRVKLFLGRCIFCGMCQDVCPAEAIRLTREFELSAVSRDDLVQEVCLRLLKCAICGKPFTTVRLARKVMEEVKEGERTYVLICPECRARLASKDISFARW